MILIESWGGVVDGRLASVTRVATLSEPRAAAADSEPVVTPSDYCVCCALLNCIARPVHYTIMPNGAPHMAGKGPEAVTWGIQWGSRLFHVSHSHGYSIFCFLGSQARWPLRLATPTLHTAPSVNKYGYGSYNPLSALLLFFSQKLF